MDKTSFAIRYSAIVLLAALATYLLGPGLAEANTLLLIITIETLAIALSGLAVFVFTQIDLTRYVVNSNIGFVFLGVHVCTGLSVLGVYITQMGA